MKPDQRAAYQTAGNLTGETHAMTIDAAAMAHIMNVLTDLYSDPEAAVLREYATNARDAHIAAGVADPIEVVLPSSLRPFLTIRDHGVGMSGEDIRNIYSKYGASTKRDTNAQNGMLGLGCKSALTYCDQFTLTGVKDGRRVQVAIGRDEAGGGSMTVVSDEPTTDRNGVEVSVPTRRHNAFAAKAGELFRFWPDGSVLVNDEAPARIEGEWVADDLVVIEERGEHLVVMAGVAYPARELNVQVNYGHRLVAFVDTGDVHFAPSREALQYTDKTKARLAKIAAYFTATVTAKAQAEVNAAPDKGTALATAIRWRAAAPAVAQSDLSYRGETVPANSWSPAHGYQAWRSTVRDKAYSRTNTERIYNLNVNTLARSLLVEGFDLKTWSASHRHKAIKLLEDRGLVDDVDHIAATTDNDRFPTAWAKLTIPFADIRAVKMPATTSAGAPRVTGSYFGYGKGHGYVRDIPATDLHAPLYFKEGTKYSGQSWAGRLDALFDDYQFVVVPATRIAKFKRDFPYAVPVADAEANAAKAWWAKTTADQRLALAIHIGGQARYLKALDPNKIDDPVLARYARLARRDIDQLSQRWHACLSAPGKLPADENPLRHYPLLTRAYGGTGTDHVHRYINAEFKHLTTTGAIA